MRTTMTLLLVIALGFMLREGFDQLERQFREIQGCRAPIVEDLER